MRERDTEKKRDRYKEREREEPAKLWQLSESGHLFSEICKLRTGHRISHTHTHAGKGHQALLCLFVESSLQ